jgi:hypothetical protein
MPQRRPTAVLADFDPAWFMVPVAAMLVFAALWLLAGIARDAQGERVESAQAASAPAPTAEHGL